MKEWEKHLERAANLLLENNMFSEARSEAYYAMFHAAKALLALRGIYPKTHAGVVSQFGLQFVTEGLMNYMRKVWQKQKQSVKRQIMIYISSHPKKKPKILSKMRRNF